MQNFINWLSTIEYGNFFLFILRFGVFFIIFGFFLMPKKRKTKLKSIIQTHHEGIVESTNPIVRFAENMMDRKSLRNLKIKEKNKNGTENSEYIKIKNKILAAGGLYNATPQTIQFFRLLVPLILFFVILPTYFFNISIEKNKVISDTNVANEIKSSDSLMEGVDSLSILSGKSEESISLNTVEIPKADPIVVMWLSVLPLLGYFLPEYYLKYLIKKRIIVMQKEIPTFRTFVVSMLETKTYPVYNILKILVGSTTALKEPIMEAQNEYYVDSHKAIVKLSNRVEDEEFKIVCSSLAQAVNEDKETTLLFLKQKLAEYDKMHHLKEQEKVRKKPNLFVLVLGIPLICILIIWFYPWFLDAMDVLGSL